MKWVPDQTCPETKTTLEIEILALPLFVDEEERRRSQFW